jgi:hypothetical protein
MELMRIHGTIPHLTIEDFGGFQSRNEHTMRLMWAAIELYRDRLTGKRYDFQVYTGDNPHKAPEGALTYCETDTHIAIPEFNFSAWPEVGIESYESMTRAIAYAGSKPAKHDVLFWIGIIPELHQRELLYKFGQDHPDLANIVKMNWERPYAHEPEFKGGRQAASAYVSLPGHCEYSMLIDVAGTCSSGRLKYLLHSNRPVFVVDQPECYHGSREWWFKKMQPVVDYIPIARDLSDLAHWITAIRASGWNPSQFAKNHLRREDALARWGEVLEHIAK